jgi:hypothetical protein
MTEDDAKSNTTRIRLLQLAQEFHHRVEAPSEEDVETLFWMLINRRLSALEAFVKSFNTAEEDRNHP